MPRLRPILAAIERTPNQRLCAACLAKLVDLPTKRVHDAMLKVELCGPFTREYGECTGCGKTRMVVGRRQ